MNRNAQIDFIEEVMKRAYSGEENTPELSKESQNTIMNSIYREFSDGNRENEVIEKKFLYISWIAAGIAATLLLISSLTFAMQHDNFESDIDELYADNTLDNLTTAMVGN
jgi:hypothetical protein